MKKIYTLFTLACVIALVTSCNNEWEDEQYVQYVSFKAPIGDNGVTDIYIRYNSDGKVTYQLPLIISGSTDNNENRTVHVAVDPDTLAILNDERFGREDLYYRELESEHYSFPETVEIPAGTNTSTLDIDFTLSGLDMVEKWVLPLTIEDDASYNYQSHPRKNYAKALLRVLPFNDYSGSYSTTTLQIFIMDDDGNYDVDEALVTSTRTAYVVDENTVFFYAGAVDEDLIDRSKYKIYFNFGQDESKLLTLSTDNPEIKLEQIGTPSYSVSEIMDATLPYLLHRYVTFTIEYNYVDYTSAPGAEIPYKVKGTMTLERKINTQIPDEDQAIEW